MNKTIKAPIIIKNIIYENQNVLFIEPINIIKIMVWIKRFIPNIIGCLKKQKVIFKVIIIIINIYIIQKIV